MKISVIVPTFNEAPRISSLLNHTRKSAGSIPMEIIVVDGNSQDETSEKARRFSDQVLQLKDRGRAVQMHAGALAAHGDILLFLHADTFLPDKWAETLVNVWNQNPAPALTAFRLSFDKTSLPYKLISSMAHLRTKWITGVPHGDQALAVRKNEYLQSGGFPKVPLMEEYYLARLLKKEGRVHLLPEKVVTSSRKYEKNGILFNNMRNFFLLMLFLAGVSTNKLAKLYR